MDITNNVSIPSQLSQTAGANIDDSSSEFEISSEVVSKKKKNVPVVNLTEEDLISILNGQDLSIELDNFNMADINKIPYFNKLSNNQKTLIINRLYEKVPKNQKLAKHNDSTVAKDSYFYCKNCGYNEKIPDKMFIFSRSYEKSGDDFDNKFINYKHDKTLPFSKKYNCINKECSTHKNPIIKNAVFYRLNNTYTVRYICTICDSYWSTNTEN
jgi:hypothetical protein